MVVGALLVGAALLKAHGLLTEASTSGTYVFQLVLIEVELFLGLALVLAIQLHISRLAALALFAVFAVAALVQAVAGAQSCACLGSLEADPWIMASLDLCLLAILWLWKPLGTSSSTQSFRGALFLGCCAFPALLPVLILSERGRTRPQSGLIISHSQVDLGEVQQASNREFELSLKNPHQRQLTVYEVDSSCPCLQAQGLPWHFAAGESKSVKLTLDLHKEAAFSGSLLMDVTGRTPTKTEAFRGQVKVRVVTRS